MNDRSLSDSVDGAFLITFLTGLFYVAGQAYFSGAMSFYGIHASVLELSFSEAVHVGFFASAGAILTIAYWVVIGTTLLSVAIWVIYFTSKAIKLGPITLKTPRFLTQKTEFGPVASLLDRLHSILSGWGLIALIAMLILFFADKKLADMGRESAKLFYTTAVSGKSMGHAITASIQGRKQSITVIHCAPDLCAVLSIESKKVFFLKKEALSDASIDIEGKGSAVDAAPSPQKFKVPKDAAKT